MLKTVEGIYRKGGFTMKAKAPLAVVVLAALVLVLAGVPGAAGQPEPPMVTLLSDATIYAWPNARTAVLGQLPGGAAIPVNGRSGDGEWWRLSYGAGPDGNGWISAADTRPNRAAAAVPAVNVAFVTATPVPCAYNASYVADVTIPDGARVGPAQAFTKTWRIRNTGNCPWPAGSTLAFNEGYHMSGPDSIALPPLAPGDTTDLSVGLFAPTPPGTYKGIWMFQRPDGYYFGDRISVTITVPRPAPTPTPLPPPPPPTPVPPPAPPPVPWPPPVVTIQFWSDQSAVGGGQCTTLHWSVNNVQAVYLEYRDKDKTFGVAGNDAREVCPSSDGKNYRLRVIKRDGSEETRDLRVDISDAGKVKIDFSVDDEELERGGCTVARWTTQNADRVEFFDGDDWDRVNRSDRRQVCPDHTTKYKLKVHDIYGGDHEKDRKVKVVSH